MFEKLKPDPEGGWLSRTSHNLWIQGFHEDEPREEVPATPEPYFAVIDGKPYLFSYDDTHVARCVENPLLSAIIYEPKDEQGEVTGGACIYGQDQVMEDLAAQGFLVDEESLAEAQANYHVFHPRGNEQARLN